MDSMRFRALADQFSQKHILVIGDLMLDSYMWGETNRISPEAPVPVVSVKDVTHNPGGAANVGWNIASLSASVSMAGVIGKDSHGGQLLKIMSDRGMNVEAVVEEANHHTIVKTRVIAQNQQVVRTDFESLDEIPIESINTVQASLEKNIKNSDAIILADYNKVVTLGAEGMLLTTEDTSIKIPTKARAVHDVSGAGDTVIATFALAELAGATPEEAATLANLAAGRVCEEVGVVPINLDFLTEILNHHHS